MCLEYRTVIENDSQQSVLRGKIAVHSTRINSNNRQQQQTATADHNNRQRTVRILMKACGF